MAVKWVKANELDRNVKATIHKTGKLGFSSEAIEKLELDTDKAIRIGFDDELEPGNLFYLMVEDSFGLDEESEKERFKVLKAGDYFYVNAKPLFDELKLEYDKESFIYLIFEEKIGDSDGFILKRKLNTIRKKKLGNGSNDMLGLM